jgi:methylmalonyl-CoA mutase
MTELTTTGRFPAPGEADWNALVNKALGGAARDSLNSRLPEGLLIEPLHTRASAQAFCELSGEPGAAPFIRGAPSGPSAVSVRGGWQIMQLLDIHDAGAANAQARDDLASGSDGLWVQLGGGVPYGGGYLGARDLNDWQRVFDQIELAGLPVYLNAGWEGPAAAAMWLALAQKRGVGPDRLAGSLGLDPISVIAATGEMPVSRARALGDAIDAAHHAAQLGYGGTPLCASGRVWHQAGGSAVEELALMLCAGLSYWRALEDAGVAPKDGARQIAFHMVADTDLFVGIAKFRAMRALWAFVTGAAGIAPQPALITAEMSFRAISALQPHTNMLRATASCFAAALGGASAIVLLPFSATADAADGFSRRMARNTQLILRAEAHLGRVGDAAGGAWAIETITHELAERTWTLVREIEAAGGLLPALASGLVAGRLAGLQADRRQALARGKEKRIGVSSFPYLDEPPAQSTAGPDVTIDMLGDAAGGLDLPPAGRGERTAALIRAAQSGESLRALHAAARTTCEPIPPLPSVGQRDADPFEQLRARSDHALAAAGVRPSVFLANLGAQAAFTARANLARQIFEVGGIAAIDGEGARSNAELAHAFRESGASIACLCGTDAAYAEMQGAADMLKRLGADAVYLCGSPGSHESLSPADARAINRLIHDDCDRIAILNEAHTILRIDDVIAAAGSGADKAPEAGGPPSPSAREDSR